MPGAAPGPTTGSPSSNTRPVVGRSSPATMRSSVDLPQPEGPRMQMNSASETRREAGSIARVAGPPPTPGKVRLTSSIARVGTRLSGEAPGEQALVHDLEEIVGHEADHADHHDPEDDLAGVEQRLAVGDHVADAARRADQLGDDDVGPGPAEDEAQALRHAPRARGQEHAPNAAH